MLMCKEVSITEISLRFITIGNKIKKELPFKKSLKIDAPYLAVASQSLCSQGTYSDTCITNKYN